ncbi:SGNH/GDSL hydrolase family protein [Niallia taxi]|uniref:SGNH/GDSL hydrolase family protein n=1 Tax=Niallia taxi TaxID=2499688 RepID=UPI00254B4F48|nr:SGNH/GDSL hydrolase family protein [Niallia taxi]MDK8641699.1 SGNH/GDSL hydrolase family protein [Niallia taxi]
MRPFTLIISIITLLLLSSCGNNTSFQKNNEKETVLAMKQEVPESFVSEELNVVAAGDSLTQGVGDSTGTGGYVPYLQKLFQQEQGIGTVTINNYGVKGNRTDQLLKKIKSAEVKQSISDADMVILTIGGNDIMKVVRDHISNLQLDDFTPQMKTFETNLYNVLREIRKDNQQAAIVLVGVYNPFTKWFADVDEMNDIVTEWNRTGENILTLYDNTYFVPIEQIFTDTTENLLYTDYFHPNDKGYKLIADEIYTKVKENAIGEILATKRMNREDRGE